MPYRSKPIAFAASAVLLASLFGCADSTLTKEPQTSRPYMTEPVYGLCPQREPELPAYNEPLPPYDFLDCPVVVPPNPLPDRVAFADGDAFMTQVDSRADLSTAELFMLEQSQGYQSLRAYLDPNEWTQENAEAGAGSEDATGNEGVAYANDGVTRNDFPVGDGILSLLNARGEIQVGDSVYKLTRDNAYAVHVTDLAVLREKVPTLSSPAPADGDPRIVTQPVETTDTPVADEPVESSLLVAGAASIAVKTSNCTWRSGNYRMHGKSYITNALFYSEAGVKTEWERRKLLVLWFNTWQAGTLGYSYVTGNLQQGSNSIFPTSGSEYATGTSSVHKTIAARWFTSIHGTIEGTHTSPLGYCFTRVSVS